MNRRGVGKAFLMTALMGCAPPTRAQYNVTLIGDRGDVLDSARSFIARAIALSSLEFVSFTSVMDALQAHSMVEAGVTISYGSDAAQRLGAAQWRTQVIAPLEAFATTSRTGNTPRGVFPVVTSPPIAMQLVAMTGYRPTRTIGVLTFRGDEVGAALVATMAEEAARTGLSIVSETLPTTHTDLSSQALGDALQSLLRARIEWLYLGVDSLPPALMSMLTEHCQTHKIIVFSTDERLLRNGTAAFGVYTPSKHVGSIAGMMATQVLLTGRVSVTNAAARYEMLVNLTAARRYGRLPSSNVSRISELLV
jgi:hypothetical protein